jgi:5-methylcytosine-specific restriction endonuclease McrA
MIIKNTLFHKTLKLHKILIAEYVKKEEKKILVPLEKTGKELAMVYADFKCQKCKTEDNLQYHHLISRINKPYMDEVRYQTQRKYWANILILCYKHHQEIESVKPTKSKDIIDKNIIPQSSIEKIKKKYGVSDAEA